MKFFDHFIKIGFKFAFAFMATSITFVGVAKIMYEFTNNTTYLSAQNVSEFLLIVSCAFFSLMILLYLIFLFFWVDSPDENLM